MRIIPAAIGLAVLLVASTVQAAGLTGMGKNLHGNYFNFGRANLPEAPVSAIRVGGLTVKLQSTRLADVASKFGGSVVTDGDATWICYHNGEASTWFISNALGGQEFVMIVAVEAGKRVPADCQPAPADFALPDFGIPGLGATTAELRAAFGAASGGKVAYRSDRPGGYADIAQYIGYVLRGGKVTGYGVGETSVPTAH